MEFESHYLQPGNMVRLVCDFEDADFCLAGTKGSIGIVIPFEDYLAHDTEIAASQGLSSPYELPYGGRLSLDRTAVENCWLYPIRYEKIKPPDEAILRQHHGHVYCKKGSIELLNEYVLEKLNLIDHETFFIVDRAVFLDHYGQLQTPAGCKILVVEIRIETVDETALDFSAPPVVWLTHFSGEGTPKNEVVLKPLALESIEDKTTCTLETAFQVPDRDGPFHFHIKVPPLDQGETTINHLRLQAGDRVRQTNTIGLPLHTGTIISVEEFISETEKQEAADTSRRILYQSRNYSELAKRIQIGIDQGARYTVRLDNGRTRVLPVDVLEKIL